MEGTNSASGSGSSPDNGGVPTTSNALTPSHSQARTITNSRGNSINPMAMTVMMDNQHQYGSSFNRDPNYPFLPPSSSSPSPGSNPMAYNPNPNFNFNFNSNVPNNPYQIQPSQQFQPPPPSGFGTGPGLDHQFQNPYQFQFDRAYNLSMPSFLSSSILEASGAGASPSVASKSGANDGSEMGSPMLGGGAGENTNQHVSGGGTRSQEGRGVQRVRTSATKGTEVATSFNHHSKRRRADEMDIESDDSEFEEEVEVAVDGEVTDEEDDGEVTTTTTPTSTTNDSRSPTSVQDSRHSGSPARSRSHTQELEEPEDLKRMNKRDKQDEEDKEEMEEEEVEEEEESEGSGSDWSRDKKTDARNNRVNRRLTIRAATKGKNVKEKKEKGKEPEKRNKRRAVEENDDMGMKEEEDGDEDGEDRKKTSKNRRKSSRTTATTAAIDEQSKSRSSKSNPPNKEGLSKPGRPRKNAIADARADVKGKGASKKGKGSKRGGGKQGEGEGGEGQGKKRIKMVRTKRKVPSCDACRLRRVRCDRGEEGHLETCSACDRKGIACTDIQSSMRPKERGGRLISKAKSMFGASQPPLQPAPPNQVPPKAPFAAQIPQPPLSTIPGENFPTPPTIVTDDVDMSIGMSAAMGFGGGGMGMGFGPDTSNYGNGGWNGYSYFNAGSVSGVGTSGGPSNRAEGRLVTREMTRGVGKALLRAFYLYTHPQIPILSTSSEEFYSRFEPFVDSLTSERSKADLTPEESMTECLVGVILAFGARVTDHPAIIQPDNPPSTISQAIRTPTIDSLVSSAAAAIHVPGVKWLGLGGEPQTPNSAAPSIWSDGDSNSPPRYQSTLRPFLASLTSPAGPDLLNRDLSEFGLKRDAFARELGQRALHLIDERGACRIPTLESVQALVLMKFLLDFGDRRRAQGHYLFSSAIEHMRRFVCDRDTLDPTGEAARTLRPAQGGLVWWFLYMRDAVNSCLTGRVPRVTDEDVELLSPVSLDVTFERTLHHLQSEDISVVADAAITGLFSHWTRIARNLAQTVLGPFPSNQPEINEAGLQAFWQGTDESYILSSEFSTIKSRTFGPLASRFDATLRLLCMSRATVVEACHLAILRRLEQVEVMIRAGMVIGSGAIGEYADRLRRLKKESDSRVLTASRDVVGIIESNLRTSLFLGTGLWFDLLPTTADILLNAPIDNDYFCTLNWSPATKTKEVKLCITALRQLGWCWPHEQFHVQRLEAKLQSMNLNSNNNANNYSSTSASNFNLTLPTKQKSLSPPSVGISPSSSSSAPTIAATSNSSPNSVLMQSGSSNFIYPTPSSGNGPSTSASMTTTAPSSFLMSTDPNSFPFMPPGYNMPAR